MKNIYFLSIIVLGMFFTFSRFVHPFQQTQQASPRADQVEITPAIQVGLPTTVTIPVINISAPIEPVGMDREGRMGVPQLPNDTGWYKYGYKPGENGSAVLDGHFDTPTGSPAVFYNLSKLKKGDTIMVTDSLSHTYSYSVVQVTSYPFNMVPMEQIFARNDKPRLNLITCDGTWNRAQHNYSNRAVIYTELQN